MDRNEQKALDVAADYRDMAALCTSIKPILQTFDGKCYNCKLKKALQEVGRIYCNKNRYIEIFSWTERTRIYATLAAAPLDEALQDGKRLNAAALIADCNLQREKYLKKSYAIEAFLPHVDEYMERFAALKRAVDALRNEVPREHQEIYDLRYRLINY